MIKGCKRCENEPKVPGLPVGERCLQALRTELAEYDLVLAEDELGRAQRRRDELATQVGPHVEEMDHLESRIEELSPKKTETAEQQAERQKLEADNQALEAELLETENAELEARALTIENARLEHEALTIENARLEAGLDK